MAKMTDKAPRMRAAKILDRVFSDQAYSHLALNESFREHRLADVDTRFVTEVVYGTIKRLNTIDDVLGSVMKNPLRKTDRRVKTILRMSVYQLLFMDRVPERAAIHEGVELAKAWGRGGLKGFVNGVLRNVARQGLPDYRNITDPVKRIALSASHPEWLVSKWVHAYGEAVTQDMCEANVKRAYTTLRVNRLQTDRSALQAHLDAGGVKTTPGNVAPDSLIVTEGQPLHSEWFKKGAFSFQDESSMLVTYALDPQPGMRVLDACAAPGGKATHIAERMGDDGEVLANDIHFHKRTLITEQAERLRLKSIKAQTDDATELAASVEAESFDRVLVDAPCSGLGVLRAKPDIKWHTDPKEIETLAALQLNILEAAAECLKPGGFLVYSTCTVMPAENEDVIAAFLENNASFELDDTLDARLGLKTERGQRLILPQQYESDGFFIAAMKKRGNHT
ncbi:16S rRNA (cytosine(967)-C(5))-methyltransferase RsmB [Salicibibacter cibarius]|uniref:16S rRNA (cytosine(967)-C(5))-methyltransferase n=1 Tax=Salicibibacter cibarius TaxID=2743000 RepID=A0A7T6Z4G2_9BACI|nr:16S rRNA (cytosine(967)-C(5))-methyltransferase RsmB [Salicibibacter cibarius]QQK76643.1 16S rRNA (cytosine(967)-C(5))-methyltransferase RsmB [Salicibibacter cibarius]